VSTCSCIIGDKASKFTIVENFSIPCYSNRFINSLHNNDYYISFFNIKASPGALARADLNLEDAIDEGSDYGLAKAQSIRFEEDIEEILTADDFCFERLAHVAHLRTDFLIHDASPEGERTLKVALECKHDLRNRYTVTLGQAIILRSLPGIDAVLLCVPYLRNFDAHILQTYRDQGIPVTTPDTLSTTLGETFDTLRASQSSSQRPSPPQKPR